MTQDNSNSPKGKKTAPAAAPVSVKTTEPITPLPPLFRGIDWWAFALTTVLIFIGYFITLATDVTLEDSGELAVGSYYAGVPHPPGYPVWTLYTWFFTVILPFSNIAWRVSVASAVAGALGCGLLALMVSRGSSLIIEGTGRLKDINRRSENALCLVAGFVAGMLMGFNGYMWSQSVIVEVYSLSVLSLMGVLCFLLRWMYAPHQRRYLYYAFFFFGICLTNHMSLLVAAMGIEIAIMAAQPKLGRDLFFGNFLIYLVVLFLKAQGNVTNFDNNLPLYMIFNFIGISSLVTTVWLTMKTKSLGTEWKSVLIMGGMWLLGAAFYLYMPIASMSNPPMNWGYPRTAEGFMHALKRGQYDAVHPTSESNRFFLQIVDYVAGAREEFNLVYLLIALVPIGFYVVQIVREGGGKNLIWLGSALGGVGLLLGGLVMVETMIGAVAKDGQNVEGLKSVAGILFYLAMGLLLVALVFALTLIHRYMQKLERAWITGLGGIYICLALLLMLLLNPGSDKQSLELNRVFFTASHLVIAMSVGYGLALIGSFLITHYERLRLWALCGAAVAVGASLYTLADVVELAFASTDISGVKLFFHGIGTVLKEGDASLRVYSGIFLLCLSILFLVTILIFRTRLKFSIIIGLFALMPAHSILSHWFENEQRGHLFGYWFGHDMFTPPFKVYPEMTRDAVLFGGTDPGRFNPTYMIFCESFVAPKDKPLDPAFDRRDVYLITQNALADGTYLNYIRAHYNRSAQIDPPFFQNFFKTAALRPLDNFFLKIGDNIEKERRAGSSYFQQNEIKDLAAIRSKLQKQDSPLSKYLFENISKETQGLLASGDEAKLKGALAKDLNALLEKELYNEQRFQQVKLSERTRRFIKENPQSHTLIRLNRLLLEEAYPTEFERSNGGVYPDLEILTPSPEDSQKCFNDYLVDAERRYRANQLKPGEDFHVAEGGRVQVSGQVAVMAINGLLTKVIFDKNPAHDFYVEESFPLDWMFPHLTPYGVIMKINREPIPEMTQEIVDKDHQFWSQFSERLIGNWITYDTPVTNICAFAEKMYLRHDFKGFKGDPKFIRDDNGQKAFSKLRSSIGGIYSWRLGLMEIDCPPAYRAKSSEEGKRIAREAEFAFKQAFAFCPFSPEAVYRYVRFLTAQGRIDDAIAVAKTCQRLDPANGQIDNLVSQLENNKNGAATPQAMNLQTAFAEIEKFLKAKQTNQALNLMDQILASPQVDPNTILLLARGYVQMGNTARLEVALQRLVKLVPDNPEAWYDLAGLEAIMGKTPLALEALQKAVQLSVERLKQDSKAKNLNQEALNDPRFANLRQNPEFQKIVGQK